MTANLQSEDGGAHVARRQCCGAIKLRSRRADGALRGTRSTFYLTTGRRRVREVEQRLKRKCAAVTGQAQVS
ncbi:hypothetical protein LBW62_04285 [Ralstonia solanacearum]|uniref:hypothetical protein n=1 Tax=Ralstonia solanacearum TaxID=305 RepID=UPI0012D42891|nr:hypothetical protein [Ralstonia solanacearum]MDB0539828.1 hypothetical protein [Ralstonia solanacearum]MDB0549810.1 hypothetical protein [Ralstonia solanacearum]MDB0555414.1 hypothetical protein [Ralstonia solanacearum]